MEAAEDSDHDESHEAAEGDARGVVGEVGQRQEKPERGRRVDEEAVLAVPERVGVLLAHVDVVDVGVEVLLGGGRGEVEGPEVVHVGVFGEVGVEAGDRQKHGEQEQARGEVAWFLVGRVLDWAEGCGGAHRLLVNLSARRGCGPKHPAYASRRGLAPSLWLLK